MTASDGQYGAFLFALIAFGAALMVTVLLGWDATRHHLAWLWLGSCLFFGLWWTLLGCRRSSPNRPLSDHAARTAQLPRRSWQIVGPPLARSSACGSDRGRIIGMMGNEQ